MGVVRGDRIGESRRLNRRSIEAQEFYALLIAAEVPDDFGRFRLSPAHVALRMYPRREPTQALLRRVKRLLSELGSGEDPLWSSWQIDGVEFAELSTGRPRGNRYHRTPEPPGSSHVHTGACLSTAVSRAVQWNPEPEAQRLSIQLKELRSRKAAGTPLGGDHPSLPSPPFVPSPPTDSTETDSSSAAPPGEPDPIEAVVDEVLGGWSERTGTKLRAKGSIDAARKRVRRRLKEGFTPEQLAKCVEFALKDSFYRSKGYAKNTSVLWRDADRVTDLQTRVPSESSQARGQPPTAGNTAVLDQWEREVMEGKR
jgi:hypothetical protein